ncbi:DMT family transporter [Roseivirga sp.]|uniref:DMT family transporter n=1 Tax=Roseivirga sp. TaxID=1964215 RepID=UPI003B528542
MNNINITVLALLGGVLLAIQGGFNSQLSSQLKSPFQASLISFFISTLLAATVIALGSRKVPNWEHIKAIPVYLWFSGALFSFIGISLYYYTIPRLGISTMISLGLTGQMAISVIAGHYGWFGLNPEPISARRIIGLGAMVIGIILINKPN